MEPLLRSEFDATSVEPDGYIEVVYYGEIPNETYFFSDIKRWHWSADYQTLAIIFNGGQGRVEVPVEAIRKVRVRDNSEGYVLAQQFISAVDEIEVVEAKLRFLKGKMLQKREEMLRWHATSSSK
jgi:hypothetical protein